MSALKNELGDFRQNSHEFFGEQRKVSGIAYLPLTFRLPSAYHTAYPAAYLAFTGSPTSRLVLRGRYKVRLQKVVCPGLSSGFLSFCS
jgi:hypothetical protein